MRRISRILALVMAFAMMLSLASIASAATDAASAELVFSVEGTELSGKLAFSPEEGALSLSAAVASNGETADLSAYLSDKALVLAGSLLNTPYGVAFAKLAENLPKSVFAPDSGSQFALDQDTFDQIMELLTAAETAESAPAAPAEFADLSDAFTALVPAFTQAIDAASKNVTMQSSTGTISIDGKDVRVQTVKVQYGTASVIALLDSLLLSVKEDEAVQNAVAIIIDFINSTGNDLGLTGAEFVQTLVEHNQEIRDALAEEFGDIDMQCELRMSVNEEGTTPVELGFELRIEGDTLGAKLQMSENLDYIRLVLNADGESAALVFAVTEDTENAFGFRVAVQSGTDENAIAYAQNKKTQTFDVSLIETISGQTSTTTFSGRYAVEENLLSLVVDTIDGQDMGGSVTLNLRSNDTLTVPDFTELTGLGEAELMDVVQQIAEGLDAIDTLLDAA